MDHSGTKKKASCTKDGTQVHPHGWVCNAYLHHKFQYISDLRDRQTRGSSSGKLHLNRPRTNNCSRRTCGQATSAPYSCWSTITFSVGGSQYSWVCGRARAYHCGQNYGFYGYNSRHQGIESSYVDGLSLTHGASGSRQHISGGLFAGNATNTYH